MADNEKEQLRISAELDTSNLKREAQQGMQAVVNEEKKVENQSKQTSKAVDDIGKKGKEVGNALQQAGNKSSNALDSVAQAGKNAGQALQQSGSQGAEALKKVGSEADKTSQKIDEIAKATKNINLGRVFSVGLQVANSDFGKAIGSDIGNSLGLSNSAQGLAGGALTGALGGAAMGAAFGPIGAAGGALLGAASGLMQAAEQQKQAARELAKGGEERADAILKENLRNTLDKISQEEYDRIAANPFETVKGKWYPNGEEREVTAIQGAIDRLKWYMGGYEDQIQWAVDDLKMLKGMDTSNWSKEDVESWNADVERNAKEYEENTAKLEDAKKRLAAYEALLAQLNNLPVGPEIPEHIKVQRDAEADAFVGPEMPDYVKAQRDAEEQAREEARKQEEAFEKAKDMNWKKQQQDLVKEYQNQISGEESFMGKMSGVKLTDSLTKMGGGSGYGVQMQGINNYVRSISTNIAGIKAVMQKCLDTIQSIDNKYSPYGGQFISDTE